MGKMAMQVLGRGVFEQVFLHHISSLQEMFEGGYLSGSTKPSQGQEQSWQVVPAAGKCQQHIGDKQLYEVPEKIGRQVMDFRLDLLDRGMTEIFAGLAHGKKDDAVSLLFKSQNFIGNKGLGYAWITFEDISNYRFFLSHNPL